jgi:predicted  nucleic acid-binding Zn-ribbon protein
MAQEPKNHALALLREMREESRAFWRRSDEKLDRLIENVADLKRRMTSVEVQVAQLHGDFAGQSARIDRIETRLGRIERRLDLVGA